MKYRVKIHKPISNEDVNIKCKNGNEIISQVNNILFNGCDILKKDQLYSYFSRPQTISKNSFLQYLDIEIIKKKD